jgi:ATP-dependent Clp protease ATP-binding subunit ClpC
VGFAPLTRTAIEAIAVQELQAVERREGLLRRGVRLRYTPALMDFVVGAGFSPKYGARPLQRAVEQHVVAAVARALFGPVADGAWLDVDIEDGVVQVRVGR